MRGYKGKGGVYRSESLDEQMIFMVMLLVKGIVVLTVTVKERLHKIQY